MGDQGQVDQTSASWFFEERGQKDAPLVGPYRADEILKFVMDGALKVESRIYNAERDEWMVAADVIAHIPAHALAPKAPAPAPKTQPVVPAPLKQAKVSAPPKSQPAPRVAQPAMKFSMPRDTRLERSEPEFRVPVAVASAPPPPPAGPAVWQPPPRPAELRNVHVVNSVTGDTGLIDYFALINRPSHRGPAGAAGAQGKGRAPMRAAERAVAAASKETFDEESAGTPNPAGTFDFGFDFSKGLSSASGYIAKFGMILKRHQRPLYYAAAVAFVAAGAFGVVQYFGQKGREPATAANQPTAAAAKASKAATAKPENLKLSSGSTIGTGSNKVARPSGGVAGGPTQNPNPGALHSAGGYSPQQDPRNASPQYYSSSEDSARSVAGNENMAPPPQEAYPPPVDPNRPVNPPGYFPPAGGEAAPPGAGGEYASPPNPEGPATY